MRGSILRGSSLTGDSNSCRVDTRSAKSSIGSTKTGVDIGMVEDRMAGSDNVDLVGRRSSESSAFGEEIGKCAAR